MKIVKKPKFDNAIEKHMVQTMAPPKKEDEPKK